MNLIRMYKKDIVDYEEKLKGIRALIEGSKSYVLKMSLQLLAQFSLKKKPTGTTTS